MELLSSGKVARIFYSGELSLLDAPCGLHRRTRDVSDAGRLRASRLARELAQAGVTVVSGLAKGSGHRVTPERHQGKRRHGCRHRDTAQQGLSSRERQAAGRDLSSPSSAHPLRTERFSVRGTSPARNKVMAAQ